MSSRDLVALCRYCLKTEVGQQCPVVVSGGRGDEGSGAVQYDGR